MKKFVKKSIQHNQNIKRVLILIPVIALLLFTATTLVKQNADISRMKKQQSDLQAQLVIQEEENEELQALLDSDNMDEYIEQKARENGYVKSNEIVFYDISSSN